MYSFYGGQKGQDFRIVRIFSNRSEELMKDLQARWYSPVNVGDYVFINYGDISAVSTENNISTYEKNLNIDLMNCGKSYTNSIWQKIYIDENKNTTPDFPDSEENVFVFLNFEDTVILGNSTDGFYTLIQNENGEEVKQSTDEYGNWIDSENKIIRFVAQPGYSLKETAHLYTEEDFGFGYRLIACVTGATPRLQVFHQTINIEDGDPYVTCDLTNPDKPKIKFYQQRAQRIGSVYNTTLPPTQDPVVNLLTSGESLKINGELVTPTLTEPILNFNLPRQVKYFSGPLFGQGDLNDYSFTYTSDGSWNISGIDREFSMTYIEAYRIAIIANALLQSLIAAEQSGNGSQFPYNFRSQLKYLLTNVSTYESIKSYYREKPLKDSVVEDFKDNIPYDQYGFTQDSVIDDNYLNNMKQHFMRIDEFINNKYIIPTHWENNVTIWGRYGFYTKKQYDLLSLNEQKEYCNKYKNGYSQPYSIILLTNFLKQYDFLINITNSFISLNDSYFDDTAAINKITLDKKEVKYIKTVFSNLQNIHFHFNALINQVRSGDIYIHKPSGRLYQFKQSPKNNMLSVRFMGAITAPAPKISTVVSPTYIKTGIDENGQDKYGLNITSITDNILIGEADSGYREEFIFNIPKLPSLRLNVESTHNRDLVSGYSYPSGPETHDFSLVLPDAVHIYTQEDIDINNTTVPNFIFKQDVLPPQLYDLLIYTPEEFNDINRGNIYQYKNNSWIKIGTLRGTVGSPVIKYEINLYLNESDNIINNLEEQIINNNYNYPNSEIGEVVLIKVYDINTRELLSTHWGWYYEETGWITGQISSIAGVGLNSSRIENENANADKETYTAKYLNNQFDTLTDTLSQASQQLSNQLTWNLFY